jgi:orotate phosphoribosyltransferase
MDKGGFIQEIYKKGCIKIKDGKVFIDLNIIIGYPNLLFFICECFYNEIKTLNFDALVGVPYFGIVHASYLSSKLNKPLCIIKNEKKLQRELVNPQSILNKEFNENLNEKTIDIVIITDTIEKGFKLNTFINTVKTRIKNCNIKAILTICDICIANNKHLTLNDYYIYNIINIHEITNNLLENNNLSNNEFLKLYNKMNFTKCDRNIFDSKKKYTETLIEIVKEKKTNLFVSLYFTNFFHIVNVVTKLSPLICGIFINSQIIDDYTEEKAIVLRKLADEKKIILVNHIQFSFGDKTVNNKILINNFKYYDIFTLKVNTIEDINMIKEFSLDLLKVMNENKCSFIFVMKGTGYNNNFINQKILESCKKYDKFICGILLDKREYFMNNDEYLYLTDRVEVIDRTPQKCILKDKCDLLVYNITETKNLTKEILDGIFVNVKYYHTVSWSAFTKVNSSSN